MIFRENSSCYNVAWPHQSTQRTSQDIFIRYAMLWLVVVWYRILTGYGTKPQPTTTWQTACTGTVQYLRLPHYGDVIMGAMASQITTLMIVYSTVYSGVNQRKQQSSVLLAICAGNSPVTGEFPAQMASNAETVSIGWRHHADYYIHIYVVVSGSTTLPTGCPVPVKQLWTNQSHKSI